MMSAGLNDVAAWPNLLAAAQSAARGKRGRAAAASFEHHIADRLIDLQVEMMERRYRPGSYVHFTIHEPKRRLISAAPFRDRVVHHALCRVIEPAFEARFSPYSYANRVGKGTHRAVDRLQELARRHRYVLRADIVQHFASLDHAVLRDILFAVVHDDGLRWLIDTILRSGEGVLDAQYAMHWFPGDDLLAASRARGLPIGNLTSQFWSNCYLNPFDPFVQRELRCAAYVRYVDDFALFSDFRAELWAWKRAIIERLARYRLVIREAEAQVAPCTTGVPWLGFVVFPTHRRLKARTAVGFTRRLRSRWADYNAGRISFREFDATVQGWINHVRYADTWGLRAHSLDRPLPRPAAPPEPAARV